MHALDSAVPLDQTEAMTLATRLLLGAAAAALVTMAALSAQSRKVHSGPPAGLEMVPSFNEEFDGPAVDTGRWIFGFYDPRREQPTIAKRNLWGNRERQIYFDRAFLGLGIDPFRIEDGVLTIEAKPLSPEAVAAVQRAVNAEPANVRDTPIRKAAYSSGMLSTRGRFAQTYGYFEIRARWSDGKGIWPAFWLLPASGKWPPEIDILEAHGDKSRTAYHSIHSRVVADTTKTATIPGTGQDFHLYGALWSRQSIDYYIDGVKTATLPTPADMHQPMYLLANLAIGGSWPGYPDAATHFPATMQIDYIRAWRFKRAPPR